MLVLGIETSTPQASIAISTATEVVGAYQLGRGKTQDQMLVPAIQGLLADSGVGWNQLGGIAVGLGPGLFTGLRVGVATAKALAQTLAVQIVGLPSLDVLAYGVRYSRRLICACVDARRKEVFWALYRPMPGGVQRITDFRCARAEHCVNEVEALGEPVLAAGNGPLVYRDVFAELGDRVDVAGIADATPTAVSLGELAVQRLIREDSDRIVDVRPLYIRRADAQPAWSDKGRF